MNRCYKTSYSLNKLHKKLLIISLISFVSIGIVGVYFAQAQSVEPVTSFSATPRSACAVNLSWGASPTGGVSYNIEYTKNSSFAFGADPVTTTANLSYTHQDLTPATKYLYRARAVKSGVYSTVEEGTATTRSMPAVQAPTSLAGRGFVGTDTSVQYVDLIWNASASDFTNTDNGYFEIQVATTTGYSVLIPAFPFDYFIANSKSIRVGPLNPAQPYMFRVRAYQEEFGCSSTLRAESAFTASVLVPTTPKNLTASYIFQVGVPNKVTLNWTNGSGHTQLELWRGESLVNMSMLTNSIAINATSYEDTFNLESGKTYYYKLRGCTGNGCSDFSKPASDVIASAPVNFEARTSYASHSNQVANVVLSWKNNMANKGDYKIERSKDGGAYSVIGTVSGMGIATDAILTRENNSVSIGDVYSYRIRTYYGGGQYSDYSPVVDVNLKVGMILRGQAWAGISGMGWIHFNSDFDNPFGGTVKYSVFSDDAGLLSGAAWANILSLSTTGDLDPGTPLFKGTPPVGEATYGWLSFNKEDLKGCPSGACEAKMTYDATKDAYVFSGWAKLLSKDKTTKIQDEFQWINLKGSYSVGVRSPNTDIVLRQKSPILADLHNVFGDITGTVSAATTIDYGLELSSSTGKITGLAWGGDMIGWVGFSSIECVNAGAGCNVFADSTSTPAISPIVSDVVVKPLGNMEGRVGSIWCAWDPYYLVTWSYNKSTAPITTLQFIPVGGGDTFATTTKMSAFALHRPIDPTKLSTSTAYKVSVTAFDGIETSAPSESAPFITPTHYYPFVDFGWRSVTSTLTTRTIFFDASSTKVRGGPPITREWSFPFGTPSNSSAETVTVQFPTTSSIPVTLKVQDNVMSTTLPPAEQWCSFTQNASSTKGGGRDRDWGEG